MSPVEASGQQTRHTAKKLLDKSTLTGIDYGSRGWIHGVERLEGGIDSYLVSRFQRLVSKGGDLEDRKINGTSGCSNVGFGDAASSCCTNSVKEGQR
jgi:hypothetical protein